MKFAPHLRQWAWVAAILYLCSTFSVWAQVRETPGVTSTEILLGQTVPYSGPASAFGTIGKAQQAYFAKVNAEGGIGGRKIRLISVDDGFNPAKTLEQTRKLVEEDQVAALFSSLGPGTLAIRKYLGQKKVPLLILGDGDTVWDDRTESPMTVAFIPDFASEGRAFAQYLILHHPKANVAVLVENGPLGRRGLEGLQAALKSRDEPRIVATATHEIVDPTRDSQIFALKASNADVLVNFSSPRNAAQVIRRMSEIGWKPLHLMSYVATSVEAVLEPAGLSNSTGIISTGFMKQPSDPGWKDDAAIKEYFAWMKQYYPEGSPTDVYNAYGYVTAAAMVHVLRQCGNDLSRENLLRQALNLRDVELPLLLPGIKADLRHNPARMLNQLQMLRFDGKRWVRVGDVIRP